MKCCVFRGFFFPPTFAAFLKLLTKSFSIPSSVVDVERGGEGVAERKLLAPELEPAGLGRSEMIL